MQQEIILTDEDIRKKYGTPDWIGTYEHELAKKIQWFYLLEDGNVRYCFFVDKRFLWELTITEAKMLEVIYEDHEFIEKD